MKTTANHRLLTKLRQRKKIQQLISPDSASKVLKGYIQPQLSRNYVTCNYDPYLKTSPRSRVSGNCSQIASKLKLELDLAYSTLASLQLQLAVTISDKESVQKKISEFKDRQLLLETIRKNLEFSTISICSDVPRANPEVYNTEGLISHNDYLRTLVESEHSFNNIRLKRVYSLNSPNVFRPTKGAVQILQQHIDYQEHHPW